MPKKSTNQTRSEGQDGDKLGLHASDVSGLIWDSGLKFKDIAAEANLSPSTVSNLAYRETKRPQDRTLENTLDVLGYERAIVPKGTRVARAVKPSEQADKRYEAQKALREKRKQERAARRALIPIGKRTRERKKKK